jgi:hypothetical protein
MYNSLSHVADLNCSDVFQQGIAGCDDLKSQNPFYHPHLIHPWKCELVQGGATRLKCLSYKLYGSQSLLIKWLFIANQTQHWLYPLLTGVNSNYRVNASKLSWHKIIFVHELLSCSAFKLYVKKKSNSCGVGVPPALNIQFKCATTYLRKPFLKLLNLMQLTQLKSRFKNFWILKAESI